VIFASENVREHVNMAITANSFIAGSLFRTPYSAQDLVMHTVIEIRPFRGGWQCYEGPGVGPYWIGESAKDDAIDYAKARAKFGYLGKTDR
jgi:hypothetical protein